MKGLSVVLLALVLVSLSCTKPAVAGRYVSDRERTPKDTLVLEGGGAFTLQEDGGTFTGRYRLNGNFLALEIPGRTVPPLKLEGSALVDPAGGRWNKE